MSPLSRRQAPALQPRGLRSTAPASPPRRLSPRNTQPHLFMCVFFFNVANGQLNELQLVIFMVNLNSRSCWLILLLSSKTGRNPCCSGGHSNRHRMLNYGHRPEQKAQPDSQAQWPGRVALRAGGGRTRCESRAPRPSLTRPPRLPHEAAQLGTRLWSERAQCPKSAPRGPPGSRASPCARSEALLSSRLLPFPLSPSPRVPVGAN